MDIRINAIHFDISDKLTEFINKKVERLARRFVDITEADVSLRVVKPETAMNKEAGVQFNVPGNENLFASKTADSFEEAIDLCLDALEKQLSRLKEKK